MNFAVVGLGYVGIANAVMLARHHQVRALDIDAGKVAQLNARHSPFNEPLLAQHLSQPLNLRATLDPAEALDGADYVLIATPTDLHPSQARLDTHNLEQVIAQAMHYAPRALIVIKSTVPIGFIRQIRAQLDCDRVLFSPEFLREGQALYDTLYPSRIIVGERSARAEQLAQLLLGSCLAPKTPVLLTGSDEAESIKLFANSYLAMRVAFFNELDSYALCQQLDSREIIDGVALDPRIGAHYHNPSFGYGGYCLPKDSQQLLASFSEVPQNLIAALVSANATHKQVIVEQILQRPGNVVGVYRLQMKQGADNARAASVIDIIALLRQRGITVLLFEPGYSANLPDGVERLESFADFISRADTIVCNRMFNELRIVSHKVFTRDLYGCD